MSVNIPNITSDGLVFGYDAHPSSRFAPGPPLRNVCSGIGFGYGNQNSSLFKKQNSTYTAVIPGVGTRTVYAVETYNDYNGGSGNCCLSLFTFGGVSVSSSTPYTYQIIYRTKTDNVGANYMYHYEYGPSGYLTEYGLHSTSRRTALGDGWWHAWGQFTSNASANYFNLYLFHYEYGVHNKIEVADVSLTPGNSILRPSQFPALNSTRAGTAALLDLKGNALINASDITYDANGYPYFDGTNDWINLDSYATTVPNGNITVESVVKFTSMNANKVVVAHGGNGSNNKGFLFLYENSTYGLAFAIYDNPNFGWARTGIGSPATQYVNQYIHMVGTYDNQYVRLYINGNLIQTTQFTGGFERQNTFRIGNEVNRSYFMSGEIPVVKLYNKALTATEITNNYNGYKSRYGLT
jgi:hypothetical protein